MYEVIHFFTDLNDGNHAYHTGDTFPRDGVSVSDDRVKELSGNGNKLGLPLIKAVSAKAVKVEKVDEPEEDVKIAPVKVRKRKKG